MFTTLLSYALSPIRFLPSCLRNGIGYSAFLLAAGLDEERTWRGRLNWLNTWLKRAGQFSAAGNQNRISYRAIWELDPQGHPPTTEMLNWLRRAVNTAPKMEGAGFAICVGAKFANSSAYLWGHQFWLATQSEAEQALRDFLESAVFSPKEKVSLSLFSGAALAGKPMRPQPR